LRVWFCGDYLDLCERKEGENYIMRSIIICSFTLQQKIVIVMKSRRMKRVNKHEAQGRLETHTIFFFGKLEGKRQFRIPRRR
jgi:hypothetical protein